MYDERKCIDLKPIVKAECIISWRLQKKTETAINLLRDSGSGPYSARRHLRMKIFPEVLCGASLAGLLVAGAVAYAGPTQSQGRQANPKSDPQQQPAQSVSG